MKFGLKAEAWIIEILRRNGSEVEEATRAEDRIDKIDFWVRREEHWLRIQFSLDKDAITNCKGIDALHRGIVPMWVDGQELEAAYSNGNGDGLVREFWSRVDQILKNFPYIDKFSKPHSK